MDVMERDERTRTLLRAVIDFNKKAVQVDCIVKNISASGARLDVPELTNLPNTFNLRIPHRGESYSCALIWRDRGAIGVRFAESRDAPEKPAPGDRLSVLELENQRLKRRVLDLTQRLQALGQDPLYDERA